MLTDAKLCSSLATTFGLIFTAAWVAPAAVVAVVPMAATTLAFAFICVPTTGMTGIKLLIAAACAIKSLLSSKSPMPIVYDANESSAMVVDDATLTRL